MPTASPTATTPTPSAYRTPTPTADAHTHADTTPTPVAASAGADRADLRRQLFAGMPHAVDYLVWVVKLDFYTARSVGAGRWCQPWARIRQQWPSAIYWTATSTGRQRRWWCRRHHRLDTPTPTPKPKPKPPEPIRYLVYAYGYSDALYRSLRRREGECRCSSRSLRDIWQTEGDGHLFLQTRRLSLEPPDDGLTGHCFLIVGNSSRKLWHEKRNSSAKPPI